MNRAFRFVLVSLLFVAGPWVWGASAQTTKPVPSTVPLTILHTNDTHSHLLPFSYPATGLLESGPDFVSVRDRTDIGGIARRATLVHQIREQAAARKTTVWLMDAGDFSDGTPFSTEYHGEADVAAMNAVAYDFATLGNHEFNNPFAALQKLMRLARFPIICSNVTEAGKPFAQEYVVKDVGPLRIGMFGLLTHEARTYQAAKEGGLQIADEIETARRMVALLRTKADIVIALSHAGDVMDHQIASQVPGIDVIIGGHSHTRWPTGDIKLRSDELKADDVNGTVIAQAFKYGGELGRIDLLFARDSGGAWHVTRYHAQLLSITAAFADDPKVAATVDQYWRPIASRYGEVLGQAEDDFTARGDDEAPYNLVADAIRETFGTDFDLENTSSVRAPIVKGPITSGDIIMMDPFLNTVVTLKMSGRDLKQVLTQHRPYVSGMKYRLENGTLVDSTVNGSPLEDARLYTVSTNSYFANYAFKGLQPQDLQDTKRGRRDVVMEYVKKKRTLKPLYDGRRVVIGNRRTSE